MKLITGLGNPGKQYEKTRHNIGFMVVEQFLKDVEPVSKTVWANEPKLKSDIVELNWKEEKIILAKPKTYMNNSSLAVKLLITNYQLLITDVWVVHDDVDLPLGSIKIRFGGAAAGHKGVESIINALGTDKFWRFRLGVGHPRHKFQITNSKSQIRQVDDYVLGKFTGAQWGKARELIKRGSKALQTALEEGLETAQNKFNTK